MSSRGFSARPGRRVLSLTANKFTTPWSRRQAVKQRRNRQRELKLEARRDRAFTAVAASDPPHMEWILGEFTQCTPKPLPSLTVKAEIMGKSLQALGSKSPDVLNNSNKLSVFADTCCQTCTAGPDLIAALGCPESALAPTSHSIKGIADSKVPILSLIHI